MVTFRSFIVPIMVFVIFAVGGLAAYQVADFGQQSAAHGPGTTATNESHIQQVGIWQYTDNATNQYVTGFNDSPTVYNNSSARLVEGTDYKWNASGGALFIYSTPNTTNGNPFTITYTYYQNTQDVKRLNGPLSTITKALGNLPILAAGLGLVVLIIGFGTFVAKYLGSRSGPRTNR